MILPGLLLGAALAAPAADPRPVVVAFGDSLTFGYGVKRRESYPALLESLLAGDGLDYRVVNAGVSGDTTAGALRRVDAVLAQKPEAVVVCLGANDGLRGFSIKYSRANLSEILGKLKAGGARVLLAGMKLPVNYGPEYRAGFEAMYAALAAEHGVELVPFLLEGVAMDPALNLDDGIHPNPAGYQVVSKTVFAALAPLLRKARTAPADAPKGPGPS